MSGASGAAADFDGLVGIGEGIGEPAELRPGVAAIEIELGEIFAGFLAGRVGSGLGLQLLNRLEIGLLAVQDRSDIGDRSRGSGKSGGQRAAGRNFRRGLGWNGDGDIGPAIGGVQRRHYTGADCRRSLGTACFDVSRPAGGSHAGLNDRPADRHPAVFAGGLEAQRLR